MTYIYSTSVLQEKDTSLPNSTDLELGWAWIQNQECEVIKDQARKSPNLGYIKLIKISTGKNDHGQK